MTADRMPRPARIAAALCAAALLNLASAGGQPVETPPAAPPSHPVVEDLDRLLRALASNGIPVRADTPRGPLYECLARTADPAARVLATPDYERLAQERAGRDFGVVFTVTLSNAVPCVASPAGAASAGLQAGDRILAIDGTPTTNVTLSDAIALLRGHTETGVTLRVERDDGSTATAVVARALAALPAIELAEAWPRRLGYARVNGFYAGSATAATALVRGWADAGYAGGVLDLRGAGGESIGDTAAFAGLFASPGSVLFSFRDAEENDLGSHKAAGERPLDLPLMVLVDETTHGAAEVFAAAAFDSLGGLLLVGRPTRGDPAIRSGLPLPGELVLYIATRRLVTGNGSVLDGRAGVEPHLAVERAARADYEPPPGPDRRTRLEEEDGDRALRDRVRGDAVLQRAVDVLLGLKALNIKPGAVSSP